MIELYLVIKKRFRFSPAHLFAVFVSWKTAEFLFACKFSNFRSIFLFPEGKISKSSQLENLDKKLLYSLNILSDSSRARAIEGFPALYDERLVRDGFHGFWLKTKSFASAIGAVSIEIRSFGNLDYFTV